MKNLRPKNPDERKWAMIMHSAALLGLIIAPAIVLGPALVWFLKRNDSVYLDMQGKKALNFQLTVLLFVFAMFILSIIIRPLFILGFFAGLAGLIFAAIAGINIYSNGDYDYPFTFTPIK